MSDQAGNRRSPRARLRHALLILGLSTLLPATTSDDAGSGWFSLSWFSSAVSTSDSSSTALAVPADFARHDSCWHKPAVQALVNKHCPSLTDEFRGRIALEITNCHLESVGLATFPCSDDGSEPFSACARRIGSSATGFPTYTTFYSQIDTLCHFMRRDLFHLTTERAVNSLFSATSDAATAMRALYDGMGSISDAVARGHADLAASLATLSADSAERLGELKTTVGETHTALAAVRVTQGEMQTQAAVALATQREAVALATAAAEAQGQALARLGQLGGELGAMRNEQAQAFGEAKERVAALGMQSEQGFKGVMASQDAVHARLEAARTALAAIAEAHAEVLGEAKGISAELKGTRDTLFSMIREATGGIQKLRLEFFAATSFLFYPLALLLSTLLTAVPRTSSARGPLFLLLATGFALERATIAHADTLAARLDFDLSPSGFADLTALLRYALCVVGLLTVTRALLRHRDPWADVALAVEQGQRELGERLDSLEGKVIKAAAVAAAAAAGAAAGAGARAQANAAGARAAAAAAAAAGGATGKGEDSGPDYGLGPARGHGYGHGYGSGYGSGTGRSRRSRSAAVLPRDDDYDDDLATHTSGWLNFYETSGTESGSIVSALASAAPSPETSPQPSPMPPAAAPPAAAMGLSNYGSSSSSSSSGSGSASGSTGWGGVWARLLSLSSSSTTSASASAAHEPYLDANAPPHSTAAKTTTATGAAAEAAAAAAHVKKGLSKIETKTEAGPDAESSDEPPRPRSRVTAAAASDAAAAASIPTPTAAAGVAPADDAAARGGATASGAGGGAWRGGVVTRSQSRLRDSAANAAAAAAADATAAAAVVSGRSRRSSLETIHESHTQGSHSQEAHSLSATSGWEHPFSLDAAATSAGVHAGKTTTAAAAVNAAGGTSAAPTAAAAVARATRTAPRARAAAAAARTGAGAAETAAGEVEAEVGGRRPRHVTTTAAAASQGRRRGARE